MTDNRERRHLPRRMRKALEIAEDEPSYDKALKKVTDLMYPDSKQQPSTEKSNPEGGSTT
jgi:hypothetical protein